MPVVFAASVTVIPAAWKHQAGKGPLRFFLIVGWQGIATIRVFNSRYIAERQRQSVIHGVRAAQENNCA
jgi:hypothetical protein